MIMIKIDEKKLKVKWFNKNEREDKRDERFELK